MVATAALSQRSIMEDDKKSCFGLFVLGYEPLRCEVLRFIEVY
jgi:hypothetical protein